MTAKILMKESDVMTRETAKSILYQYSCLDLTYPKEDIDAFEMAIKALDQEPKTGHWIKVVNGRGRHECDICGFCAPSYKSGNEHLSLYCPYCGARMNGGIND